MSINVALLGFGTVGQGVYETVQSHQSEFRKLLGTDINIKTVLVQNTEKPRRLGSEVKVTSEFRTLLNSGPYDVIIEAIVGVEPAFSYLQHILKKGIPVITANKEMIAHRGDQLKKIAVSHGATCSFEAAVAGGIPVIATLERLLHGNRVLKIEGILNGTSNFILSTMRTERVSFEKSLSLAQEKGYAEADPSNDILGTDAFYKLMILSERVFGRQPEWKDVECKGINHITSEAIQTAERQNHRIKLVAKVEEIYGRLEASVEPVLVDPSHALYGVEGVNNAVSITTDLLGDLVLTGPGAGAKPTASAILQDLTLLFRAEASQPLNRRQVLKKVSPFY